MTHNRSAPEVSRLATGRRLVLAFLGLLLYVHGLHPYLPLGGAATVVAGLAGASLVAGASYALVASLSLRGTHRRPNAEVVLVVDLFVLLALLLAAVDPRLGGPLPTAAVAALAGASLLAVLASAAYLARPDLFLRSG